MPTDLDPLVSNPDAEALAAALASAPLPETTRTAIVQRAIRGFADSDAYSADGYLSYVVAGILRHYVRSGAGVVMSWAQPGEDPSDSATITAMRLRRDAEYERIADLFARMHAGDAWKTSEEAARYGGVTEDEQSEALAWLAEHFTELWD